MTFWSFNSNVIGRCCTTCEDAKGNRWWGRHATFYCKDLLTRPWPSIDDVDMLQSISTLTGTRRKVILGFKIIHSMSLLCWSHSLNRITDQYQSTGIGSIRRWMQPNLNHTRLLFIIGFTCTVKRCFSLGGIPDLRSERKQMQRMFLIAFSITLLWTHINLNLKPL